LDVWSERCLKIQPHIVGRVPCSKRLTKRLRAELGQKRCVGLGSMANGDGLCPSIHDQPSYSRFDTRFVFSSVGDVEL
jgi:hypothetical protein